MDQLKEVERVQALARFEERARVAKIARDALNAARAARRALAGDESKREASEEKEDEDDADKAPEADAGAADAEDAKPKRERSSSLSEDEEEEEETPMEVDPAPASGGEAAATAAAWAAIPPSAMVTLPLPPRSDLIIRIIEHFQGHLMPLTEDPRSRREKDWFSWLTRFVRARLAPPTGTAQVYVSVVAALSDEAKEAKEKAERAAEMGEGTNKEDRDSGLQWDRNLLMREKYEKKLHPRVTEAMIAAGAEPGWSGGEEERFWNLSWADKVTPLFLSLSRAPLARRSELLMRSISCAGLDSYHAHPRGLAVGVCA